jgi:AraC-like DNA-binding protein
LYDDAFDGLDLMGTDIRSISQQLQDATSFDEMKTIVENFLLAKLPRLKSKLPFDYAMKELIRNDGNQSIDTIASLSCLSLRQFERKCQERIGLSPKMFSRLARFSKAYRMRESNPTLTWTHIAHAAGYYDQMHFIRDFKQFAGVVPSFLENELAVNPFRMQAAIKI